MAAPGQMAFTKMQYGLEGTPGVAVAADTMILGEHGEIPADRENHPVEDNIGVRSRRNRTRSDSILFTDTLRIPNSYFEILPFLFSHGIKGGVTPVEQTNPQNDFLWTHTPSETGSNSIDASTIELGDDIDEFEIEYATIERIRIEGAITQDQGPNPVSIEVDWFGRQKTKTTFTSLSYPSNVNPLNAKLTQFFVDTTWAGVGGTQLTGLLRKYSIEILTGLHPAFYGQDNKLFDRAEEGDLYVNVAVTLAGNTDADDIQDDHAAGVFNVLRFKIDGPQIGSGDDNNLTLDVGGYWRSFSGIAENDRGSNLSVATFEGYYDPTGAKQLALVCTANVAAI